MDAALAVLSVLRCGNPRLVLVLERAVEDLHEPPDRDHREPRARPGLGFEGHEEPPVRGSDCTAPQRSQRRISSIHGGKAEAEGT